MEQEPQPTNAREALARIRAGQLQVIEAVLVPVWYWWLVGALTVGLAVAVDSHQRLAIASAIPVFVIAVTVTTGSMVFGAARGARIHPELLGPRGAAAIVSFVFALVVGALACAFGLRAAHTGHPATIACTVVAVGMIVGGPMLMRTLRQTMVDARDRSLR
jgi:hypothetical protein